MAITRADRSVLAEWWFTVDRRLLVAAIALAAIGLVVSFAATPAVAVKKGLPPLYFVERHALFAALAVVVLAAISLLDLRGVRRLALVLFGGGIVLMILVLTSGEEINGARRWLRIAGFSLQPSELAKPAFVVLTAWAFAETTRRRDLPAMPIAIGLFALFAVLLVQQPDVGQTVLISLVWGALFVLAGQSLAWAVALVAGGIAGLATAYFTLGYVKVRIDRFFAPTPGDNSQVDRALQAFAEGGLFGRGPGEGTIKTILPDAHTDFILAVIAEEYGAVACLALIVLFAYLTFRPILRSTRSADPFVRLAVPGLALLLAFQTLINMGVNTGLLPPKGMTLPFISAGGSSALATAVTVGMLLALTRRRPALDAVVISDLPHSSSLIVEKAVR
jgi:cell division protein FtsW